MPIRPLLEQPVFALPFDITLAFNLQIHAQYQQNIHRKKLITPNKNKEKH